MGWVECTWEGGPDGIHEYFDAIHHDERGLLVEAIKLNVYASVPDTIDANCARSMLFYVVVSAGEKTIPGDSTQEGCTECHL